MIDVTTITVAQFRARFPRDFVNVNDQDITNSFIDAQCLFNPALFTTDAQITNGYLFLTAHFLSLNLKATQGGIGGVGAFPVSGRSVGSVSENYLVPDAYKDDPYLATYTQTSYGMHYLQFILPYLNGNFAPAFAVTNP